MTDYYADNHERSEPTLGGQRDDSPAPQENNQARQRPQTPGVGIAHERRDERRYIRVARTFQVKMEDGTLFDGVDLSQGGFAIHSERPLRSGARIKASLLILAGGAELTIPVSAECRHCTATAQGRSHTAGFEITDISPGHLELLRRVIRASLSGREVDVEGLMAGEDPQTPRKRRNEAGMSAPQSAQRPPKPLGRYVALFMAFGVLALVAAATAYRNFMLIEPSFAAVTAPRIDIRAPGPGILQAHDLQAGDRVERDAKLTSVKNVDLESDLILAKAAQNYNSKLIENLQNNIDSGANQVSLANSAKPANGESVSFETVSPEIAQARIDQFETARDFQNSRITALEARQSQNEIYSPCNCLVAWALSSSDGTYINESEKIMTLIRTGENDIMVEALVHMDDIDNIDPNQKAYISLPHTSGPISARVRSVALDIERQPRAGFPNWVRQQQNVASVLLVPEKPLPADAVGTPVDVRFTEAPLIGTTAEWIWQGGRAVGQLFGGIFGLFTGDEQEAQTSGNLSQSG
ncbi:PilZ domain-containing protein [Halomonas sp. M4R1S46]|uniref:PilZ domain-containing protein n=1 Tax=Halomonas sp. M4R1S46 TaxID=2982692 RepID=UPI0021E3F7FD|nr:PilZ domain-containing protein [Halomonas sp. M4R1S46]UYG06729.1 PilZ domain-containing protein [Halomonas sp. M4R1S46]